MSTPLEMSESGTRIRFYHVIGSPLHKLHSLNYLSVPIIFIARSMLLLPRQ